MARTLTVVGLGGSLSSTSKSRAALRVALEAQLRLLGSEVARVAERFAADSSLQRAAECENAAERVAAVGSDPKGV